MEAESREPGEDRPIKANETTLLNFYRQCRVEAKDARRTRMRKNRENRRAYLGLQDWSHKNEGQSTEFLPKTPIAVEQFVNFVKKALTQFGDYYEISLNLGSQSPLSGNSIRKLLNCHLEDILVEDHRSSTFPVQLSEGVKVGALESLIILKIHGNMVKQRRYKVSEDGEEAERDDLEHWKLRIDLIRPEDYFPDPTGAGLYEIHSIERDFSYVRKRAEEGIYDLNVVNRIKEDFKRAEDEQEKRREFDKNQDETNTPGSRRKIVIDEFWGTILDDDGEIVHENCFMAVANDKYILRGPEPNPFWHGESPFVAVPIIRVPFSAWHKALFDHAAQINFSINEVYNLILDGGISAVWGIKQLRVDDLEDPRQVAGGIPQGTTLAVKSTLPHNAKVLETVSEGQVPPDAMAIFEMLNREFATASLTNELKLGSLPGGQDVKATAIVEASQSQATTMEGIIADIERELITKALHKTWLTILQNMDDIPAQKIIENLGARAAFVLWKLSPAERFQTMGSMYSIKVTGLSEVLSKTRDFQKIMAMLQAVAQIPILAQAFFKKHSPEKIIASMLKMLGINPEQIARDAREDVLTQEEIEGALQFAQFVQGGQGTTQRGSNVSAENTGGPELPAEIAAVGNPSAGLAGAGES